MAEAPWGAKSAAVSFSIPSRAPPAGSNSRLLTGLFAWLASEAAFLRQFACGVFFSSCRIRASLFDRTRMAPLTPALEVLLVGLVPLDPSRYGCGRRVPAKGERRWPSEFMLVSWTTGG